MITLRPIGPADAPAFQAFVRGLSAQSRTNRFLFPLRELSPDLLRVLTEPDGTRHVALAAWARDVIVGEARFVALGRSRRAEFALAVADAWQKRGIGTRLLDALVAAAGRLRLEFLEGEILHENKSMLGLMRRHGFRLRSLPGDASLAQAELELRLAPAPTLPLSHRVFSGSAFALP
jgi:acetyltransferase